LFIIFHNLRKPAHKRNQYGDVFDGGVEGECPGSPVFWILGVGKDEKCKLQIVSYTIRAIQYNYFE